MLQWFKKDSGRNRTNARDNDQWIEALYPPIDQEAIADLRTILIRGLKPALHKYVDRELDEFVKDVAQDALLKIIDKADTFRGDSKFTTWSLNIAVREGLSELRRKKWDDVSLNQFTGAARNNGEDMWELPFQSETTSPVKKTHELMVLQRVMSVINKELSPKQKKAMIRLVIDDLPISIVAKEMGVSRNALYKLVHDARLNLKKKMKFAGINPAEVLQQM